MKEGNKLTKGELETLLAIYQSIITIVTFFAGFVFVTIPLVIFSTEISSLYGRLTLYLLLTSLLVFTITIDSTTQQYCESISKPAQTPSEYSENTVNPK